MVPIVGRLVRAVVEHLEERRPPQVKHELEDRAAEGMCHMLNLFILKTRILMIF